MEPVSIHTLSNGLKVIHQPSGSASVRVALFGRVGFRSEPEGRSGLAHFLEHLLFDGTRKRPTSREINHLIDFHGGKRNGSTSIDHVTYWAKLIPEHREVAFDYLSDIFLNSLLSDEDIAKEQKVIADEIHMSRDDLRRYIHWSGLPLLYGPRFVGTTFLDPGPLERFDHALVDDFYRRSYTAANFVLGVAGKITEDETLSLSEKYFGAVPKGTEIDLGASEPLTENRLQVITKEVAQAGIRINLPGVAMNDDDRIIYELFAAILGRGTTSRLPQRLRHREHLAYHASASSNSYSDIGHVVLFAAMQEESIKRGFELLLEELAGMQRISEVELERGKNAVKSEFIFDEDNTRKRQRRLLEETLFYGQPKTLESYLAEIDDVSPEKLQAVATRLLESPRATTIITPTLTESDFA